MSDYSTIKNYWDTRPCNIRHSQADPGTEQFIRDVAGRRYHVEPHIIKWIDSTPHWNERKLKIMEVGCGIGTDALYMGSCGHEVHGFDLSSNSVEIARESAKTLGLLPRVSFNIGNAEDGVLPVRYGKYDVIYSYGVLHHTINPEKVIANIKRYMTKDSILKLMVYNKWSLKGIMLWLKDRSWKNSEAQPDSPLTRVYSKWEVKKLLKDFDILEMKVDFVFPFKMEDYMNYKYTYVWYWPIIRHLQKLIGWHILVTAKLKEESGPFEPRMELSFS